MPDIPERLEPELTAAEGPWGRHVCVLPVEGHPLHGLTSGVAGTVAPLVDLRGEEGRSPARMRPAPITEAGRQRQ